MVKIILAGIIRLEELLVARADWLVNWHRLEAVHFEDVHDQPCKPCHTDEGNSNDGYGFHGRDGLFDGRHFRFQLVQFVLSTGRGVDI